jgi:hypothetical protein
MLCSPSPCSSPGPRLGRHDGFGDGFLLSGNDAATEEFHLLNQEECLSQRPLSPSLPVRSPVRVVPSSDEMATLVATAILEQNRPRATEFVHQAGCECKCVARCPCLSVYLLDPNTKYSRGDLELLFGDGLSVAWLVVAALNEKGMVKILRDVMDAMEEHGLSAKHVPPFIVQTAAIYTDQTSAAAMQQLGDVIARLPFTKETLGGTISQSGLELMRPALLKRCANNPGAADLLRHSFGPSGSNELLSFIAASSDAVVVLGTDAMSDVADSARRWLRDVATLTAPLDETRVPLLCDLVGAGFDARAGFDFRGLLFKSLLGVAHHGSHSEAAVRAIQECRRFPIFERVLTGNKKRLLGEVEELAMDLAGVVGGGNAHKK